METALKRKSKKVIVSESESEEPEDQGRIIQDIDDDPLVYLVRESMKEKPTDFVTPRKALGEAQEEDISPTILEAAKTLSMVASQGVSKEKSTNKGKRYRRRARSVAKNINIGLDVPTGSSMINVLCDNLTTVIDRRWSFVRELDLVAYKFMPRKMAEFMKETQDKHILNLMKLQILGREFELRACEKDIFIEKLKVVADTDDELEKRLYTVCITFAWFLCTGTRALILLFKISGGIFFGSAGLYFSTISVHGWSANLSAAGLKKVIGAVVVVFVMHPLNLYLLQILSEGESSYLALKLHGQASSMGKINQVHTLLEGISDITNTLISHAGNPQHCDWLLRHGT
ncbi:hypothetical protein Tco_1037297 [Tanacetum coccineum]